MKRNVLIQVNDISFFAKGTEVWYCCQVYCDDWAEGLVPHREIGGWHRRLEGRLHPLEITHRFPPPERFVIDVENPGAGDEGLGSLFKNRSTRGR